MINLNWIKNNDGKWFSLINLNLNHEYFNNLEGVYVIWHGGTGHNIVRVGQGVIKDRLTTHKDDPAILYFGGAGLFVTWAEVGLNIRDGVERFLAERLKPKVGLKFPEALPIMVNLP